MVFGHFFAIEAVIVGRNGNNSTRGVQVERRIQIAQNLRVANAAAGARIDVVGVHLNHTSAGRHVLGQLHTILGLLEDRRIVVLVDDEHRHVDNRRQIRRWAELLRQDLLRNCRKEKM